MDTLVRSYSFSQVAIIQKENICQSRLDAKIEGEVIRGIVRPIPLIAANMSTVVNADFCVLLYRLGGLGVMHRAFKDNNEYIKEVAKIAEQCPVVAASVGIKKSDYFLVEQLIRLGGANIIFVDIAHGYSKFALRMCEHIKLLHPTVRVVAGNTVNPDMLTMFHHCIDAIKIGIGGGNSCSKIGRAHV